MGAIITPYKKENTPHIKLYNSSTIRHISLYKCDFTILGKVENTFLYFFVLFYKKSKKSIKSKVLHPLRNSIYVIFKRVKNEKV
jgi:hypothetical protein